MTTPLMFDAAFAPDLAACKAAGAIAMNHYLSGTYQASSPQIAASRAAGLGGVHNWERDPSALVGTSRTQGQMIAQEALTAMDPACPRDKTVKIYFSVDTLVAAGSVAACDQAFLGICDLVRPAGFLVGVYGEGALIDHLVAQGLVDGKQWLSMSASFPGFNAASPNVCMIQQHHADGSWFNPPIGNTDVNTILDPHAIGAWWPDGSPYAAEADLTPEEHNMLIELLNIAVTSRADGDRTQWPYPFTPDAALLSKVDALAKQVSDLAAKVGAPAVPASATASVDISSLVAALAGPLATAIASHVKLAAS